MKSRNFNFLEPFGPLQACNGTALPLYIYIFIYLFDCQINAKESVEHPPLAA